MNRYELMIPHNRTTATTQFVLYDENKRHFQDCRTRMLHNETWGQRVAPMVDKIGAKELIHQWSPSARIVPTLAYWNASFFDPTITSDDQLLESLMQIPQPYIMKPAHVSGTVSVVRYNEWRCIKGCKTFKKMTNYTPRAIPLDNRTTLAIIRQGYQQAL